MLLCYCAGAGINDECLIAWVASNDGRASYHKTAESLVESSGVNSVVLGLCALLCHDHILSYPIPDDGDQEMPAPLSALFHRIYKEMPKGTRRHRVEMTAHALRQLNLCGELYQECLDAVVDQESAKDMSQSAIDYWLRHYGRSATTSERREMEK
jgi:hypothetical protein